MNPGVILTDIQKRAGMTEERYQAYLIDCKKFHALGRPGDAIEVATAIAFLAGDNASFITGILMPIDGGMNVLSPIN